MRKDRKPCPFCGSRKLEILRLIRGDLKVCRQVECECGAGGPLEPTTARAVAKWNRRAASRSPTE